MRFHGIANPDQLKILQLAFDKHCSSRNITDPDEQDILASRIVSLFSHGAGTLEEIELELSPRANDVTRRKA